MKLQQTHTHTRTVVAASLRKLDQVLYFMRGVCVGGAGRQGPSEDLSDGRRMSSGQRPLWTGRPTPQGGLERSLNSQLIPTSFLCNTVLTEHWECKQGTLKGDQVFLK